MYLVRCLCIVLNRCVTSFVASVRGDRFGYATMPLDAIFVCLCVCCGRGWVGGDGYDHNHDSLSVRGFVLTREMEMGDQRGSQDDFSHFTLALCCWLLTPNFLILFIHTHVSKFGIYYTYHRITGAHSKKWV